MRHIISAAIQKCVHIYVLWPMGISVHVPYKSAFFHIQGRDLRTNCKHWWSCVSFVATLIARVSMGCSWREFNGMSRVVLYKRLTSMTWPQPCLSSLSRPFQWTSRRQETSMSALSVVLYLYGHSTSKLRRNLWKPSKWIAGMALLLQSADLRSY